MIDQLIFIESTVSHYELLKYISKKTILKPSIKRGDLIEALNQYKGLKKIVMVDGVFESCPSITHKEILWAIEKGIEVVGISSLGAIRAVELKDFGMIGFGEVYEEYLLDKINGDDEVAVSFTRFQGKIYKTIPLINLRRTISTIFEREESERLITILRSINYRDRTWSKIKLALNNEDVFNCIYSNYLDLKKEDVVNYLEQGSSLNLDIKTKEVSSNIFFKHLYAKHVYNTDFEILRYGVENISINNSVSMLQKQDSWLIYALLSLLGLEEKYFPNVAYILNCLSYFEYNFDASISCFKSILYESKSNQKFLEHLFDEVEIDASKVSRVSDALLKMLKYFKLTLPGSQDLETKF